MPELTIVADDLTGALDTAAPFAMRGIRTVVALNPEALPEAIASGARIVSVSTDSRELSPAGASSTVERAIAALPAGTRLFKKIDSRLKGNIEAELDPLPHTRSLVIPAIPAFGRLVQGGSLHGAGVSEPIGIAARLGRHAGAATIPDIRTQADIEAALAGDFDLLVGARGLAEAMAVAMAPEPRVPGIELPSGPAYCVIGSTDPITVEQLRRLRRRLPELACIAAPNGEAPIGLAAAGPLTIIEATQGTAPADARTVAAALARSLVRLSPPPGALLVLSGGATAQAILEQMHVHILDLVGEALPGLPLATAGDLTVVTKSGGFGDENTLLRLLAGFLEPRERVALS
ncbi:MAG: four-carbon acid sugar kinase family protein [Hyphomicrobiales bacterium]|nr:MAG: four-carbon acid sugar kinase family protein [Hyphomicrobiales bacterium]